MVILATFQYEVTLEEIDSDALIWAASASSPDEALLGASPRIAVNSGQITLTETGPGFPLTSKVVIPAGDAIFRAAQEGDRLFVTRTGTGAFAVSLLRDGELVVALGNVTSVPWGPPSKP